MSQERTRKVGERIREERERIKLGVAEFAAGVGVTDRSQRNYESGQRTPDAEYLIKADALGVDIDYVLTGNRSQWKTLQDSVNDECQLMEKVIGLLLKKTIEQGAELDPERFAKSIAFLYRSGRFGAPVTDAVVDELLGITKLKSS